MNIPLNPNHHPQFHCCFSINRIEQEAEMGYSRKTPKKGRGLMAEDILLKKNPWNF